MARQQIFVLYCIVLYLHSKKMADLRNVSLYIVLCRYTIAVCQIGKHAVKVFCNLTCHSLVQFTSTLIKRNHEKEVLSYEEGV